MQNIIIGQYDRDDYGAVTFDGRPLDIEPSLRVRKHSPTGFAWGYGGSGPAQLALAILLAARVSVDQALRHYQTFKWTYIAPLDSRAPFALHIDVAAWVAAREAERVAEAV